MHTLARPPVREARLNGQARLRAFTLIELLTVIGIIAILAAITFGVVKGVNERAAISQAKVELASLSLALESYKGQYGDYPRSGTSATLESTASATNQAGKFFNALLGKLGPTGVAIDRKAFVEVSRLNLSSTTALPKPGDTTSMDNAFIDPWGRFYIYAYGAGWTTYRLLSVGPDGKMGDSFNSTTGIVTSASVDGADNIYANK
ncbi:MAG: prepilin-type N-terminal cleavage/methylation domain-containing protein [Rariglobus sp.]|nr:prepilin-type N-terminal cleavage/methylation domain-containing protein [Rariglobus sp.]